MPLYAALRLRDMMKGNVPAFAGDITDSSGGTSNLKSSASGTHRKDSAIAAMANNLKAASSSSSGVAKSISEMEAPRQTPNAVKSKTAPVAKNPVTSKVGDSNPTKTASSKTARPGSAAEPSSPKVAPKIARAVQKDSGGIIGIVHRHPAASIVIGVLATVLAIAVGVILLRPGQTASAKDRSQSTGESPRTAQSGMSASN